MNHPSEPCACEMGADKCTPVGLCAAQEMVEDQTQQLRDEIEQLHKKLNAALLNCATPKDCIGWMQDQETGSQFQCGRCVNLRALMTGDSDQ